MTRSAAWLWFPCLTALGCAGAAPKEREAIEPTEDEVIPQVPVPRDGAVVPATVDAETVPPMTIVRDAAAADRETPPEAQVPPNKFAIQGWAKDATGGEGGAVVMVDSAASLKAALLRSGKRIIRFAKGGIYDFQVNGVGNEVEMGASTGDLTVDGSTAPQPVTLKYGSFRISAKNVIFRHLRFRTTSASYHDSIRFNGSAENIVIDHCSLTWDGDDTFDASKSAGAKKVTIQWSIIADPLVCEGGHPCGAKLLRLDRAAGQFSFHHNLFLNAPKGKLAKLPQTEYVNNVFMNFNYTTGTLDNVDLIANIFGGTPNFAGDHYAKGNEGTADRGAARKGGNEFTVYPVEGLRAALAKGVGATLPCRDGIDQGYVDRMLKNEAGPILKAWPPVSSWNTACAP